MDGSQEHRIGDFLGRQPHLVNKTAPKRLRDGDSRGGCREGIPFSNTYVNRMYGGTKWPGPE